MDKINILKFILIFQNFNQADRRMLFAHKTMKSLKKKFFVQKIIQEKNSVCVFWQAAGQTTNKN